MLSLREWERTQIPLFAPQIALDVLLHVAACSAQGRTVKMKEIYLAVGYSQDRIREVVKELIAGDWLSCIRDHRDGRSRLVVATAKALDLLEAYMRRMAGELDRLRHLAPEVEVK